MSRITQETLERIKERLPISVVVGKRVQMKRCGREWRALSPFNKERTPSFYVNDQKGFWHCFSSGKHGTAIDFVMEVDGLTFPEAVESLAREAGVEVTREGLSRETAAANEARSRCMAALQCAQDHFRAALLANRAAMDYLNSRGIRRAKASELGIGWAPPPGLDLLEHLADSGFDMGTVVASGLATQPEETGRAPRPFFHGRLTFPIRNTHGQVIAFGARGLGAEQPKYVNGRETPLFDKGRILYNLDRARQAIARSGTAIVLEGYFDVAAVSQSGIQNVVATMGTALTLEHLHQLWRLAPHVVLCADGDAGGGRAAIRALETALPWLAGDRRLAIARLPDGVDPDDMVRASGRDAFLESIRSAESSADALWAVVRAEHPGSGAEEFAAIESSAKRRLAEVSDDAMRRQFMASIQDRIRAIRTGGTKRGAVGALTRRVAASVPAREAALVVAALLHPEYVEADLEAFAATEVQAPVCARLRDMIVRTAADGGTVDLDAIARDVAILRGSMPDPAPSFVSHVALEGFREALDMQRAQATRRRLQASYSPQATA